jgi:hypothetical protein
VPSVSISGVAELAATPFTPPSTHTASVDDIGGGDDSENRMDGCTAKGKVVAPVFVWLCVLWVLM